MAHAAALVDFAKQKTSLLKQFKSILLAPFSVRKVNLKYLGKRLNSNALLRKISSNLNLNRKKHF